MQVFATRKVTAMGRALPKLTLKYRQAVNIMKLTGILLLATCIQVSANGLGQTITINVKGAPIQQVMKVIEKQTDYVFFYRSEWVKDAKKVTVVGSNLSLEKVLEMCFREQPFGYEIAGKYITITPKKNDIVKITTIANEEPIDVKGRVLNEKGEAVEGVTVSVKGGKLMTTTNSNGEFSMSTVDVNAVLVFSSVNMETFELKVSGKTEILVTLKAKISQLSDVSVIVSTGYQDIPKERATGSFVKVNNELLNRKVSTNILERLFGITSGLNFEPKNSIDFSKSDIIIRGPSTINSNPRPFIVIDGFPYDGDINQINPNDIESITILRDAAAASIWGVKSGNGVIVLTTKKGRYNQKTTVQLNVNSTLNEKPDLFYIPRISSSNEIDLENDLFNQGYYQAIESYGQFKYYSILLPPVVELLIAKRDGKLSASEVDSKIAALRNHDFRNDIEKYFIQKGINQQYNLNLSGGTDKAQYYASIGYDKNKGIGVGDHYSRLTARLDNSFRLLRNFEIGAYVAYANEKNLTNGSLFGSLLPIGSMIAPYSMLVEGDGTALAIPKGLRSAFVDTINYLGYLDWHYRPLDELKYSDNTNKQYTTRIGANIKYSLTSNLSIEAKYQYQNALTAGLNYYGPQTFLTRELINKYVSIGNNNQIVYPIPVGAILDESRTFLSMWNFRSQVDYSKKWEEHHIISLGGIEIREVNTDGSRTRKYGFDKDLNLYDNKIDYNKLYSINPDKFSTSNIPNIGTLSGGVNRFLSYYANSAYTFKNKYNFTASARIDGTNFFGSKANYRTVPLWSVGLAWNISKENFLENKWFTYCRLRATYGINGNTNNNVSPQALGYYTSGALLSNAQYLNITTPPNPSLRWEKVHTMNVGLDFDLFNGRINGNIDGYLKKSNDLISKINTDPTSGFTNFTGNQATMKGKGVDLAISIVFSEKKINWKGDFLFSYSSNKVISYDEKLSTTNYLERNIAPYIDRPLFSIYSFKWGGLDPVTGDPRGYLSDTIANYNKIIANTKPADLVYNGSALPLMFGSIINTFSIVGFSVSANIVYKLQYYFRRNSVDYNLLLNGWSGHADYYNRWQKPGDESFTDVPSFSKSSVGAREAMYKYSSVLVEKGDHIRLQDIRIAYDMKSKLLKSPRIQIYMYFNNLGIIWRSNKHEIDPDYGDYGFPPSRSYSLGLNLIF